MFREKKHLLLILFSFFISSYSFSQIVDGNPENGKTLFDANCTACHYSGPEEMKKIGPGLNSHILEEFSEEWLIKWTRNAPALTNSGDPLAIEVSEYDPSQHPAFTFLKDSQIKDILAYLEQDPTDFERKGSFYSVGLDKKNIPSDSSQNHQTYYQTNLKDNIVEKEQYLFCELIVTQNMFGRAQDLNFEYGSIDSIWKKDMQNHFVKLSELKKQKKIIDALNLMGFYGWGVIHTYTTSEKSYIQEHFVFQKKIIK